MPAPLDVEKRDLHRQDVTEWDASPQTRTLRLRPQSADKVILTANLLGRAPKIDNRSSCASAESCVVDVGGEQRGDLFEGATKLRGRLVGGVEERAEECDADLGVETLTPGSRRRWAGP